MAVDILIKGASIIDGTGQPRYPGDIAIKEGLVVAVGKTGESAGRTIDAAGLTATPGFWDIHTHYDAQLLWDPMASSSTWHGVTTVAMGNCGFAIAPAREEDQGYLVRMLSRVEAMERSALESTLPWRWETFAEYLDVLEGRIGVNVLALVGHSAVRRYVMGEEASQRPATEAEIQRMQAGLHEAMRAGGMGFTSARGPHSDGEGNPVPSRLATDEELKTLASAMKGMSCGFLQGVGPNSLSMELAKAAGRPFVQGPIHQPPSAPPEAWKVDLEQFQQRVKSGQPLFGMASVNRTEFEVVLYYPMHIFERWPHWNQVMAQPPPDRLRLMRDPAVRQRFREDMATDPLAGVFPFHWELLTLGKSATGRWEHLEGKTVSQMAIDLGKDTLDAFLDVVVGEDLMAQFRYPDTRWPDESMLIEMAKAPHMVIGMSDAGAHMTSQNDTGFPTYLLGHWVRELGALTAEEAVQILSARPADEVGITDRGRLLPGQAADIVLLDLDRVGCGDRVFADDLPGGGRRLVHHAEGIAAVLVNGVAIRETDRDTGDLGGQVIRSRWD